MDLASHFVTTIERINAPLESRQIEWMVDMCFQIGAQQLEQDNLAAAREWLKRGCSVCDASQAADMAVDLGDIRLNLKHTYGSQTSRHRRPGWF